MISFIMIIPDPLIFKKIAGRHVGIGAGTLGALYEGHIIQITLVFTEVKDRKHILYVGMQAVQGKPAVI